MQSTLRLHLLRTYRTLTTSHTASVSLILRDELCEWNRQKRWLTSKAPPGKPPKKRMRSPLAQRAVDNNETDIVARKPAPKRGGRSRREASSAKSLEQGPGFSGAAGLGNYDRDEEDEDVGVDVDFDDAEGEMKLVDEPEVVAPWLRSRIDENLDRNIVVHSEVDSGMDIELRCEHVLKAIEEDNSIDAVCELLEVFGDVIDHRPAHISRADLASLVTATRAVAKMFEKRRTTDQNVERILWSKYTELPFDSLMDALVSVGWWGNMLEILNLFDNLSKRKRYIERIDSYSNILRNICKIGSRRPFEKDSIPTALKLLEVLKANLGDMRTLVDLQTRVLNLCLLQYEHYGDETLLEPIQHMVNNFYGLNKTISFLRCEMWYMGIQKDVGGVRMAFESAASVARTVGSQRRICESAIASYFRANRPDLANEILLNMRDGAAWNFAGLIQGTFPRPSQRAYGLVMSYYQTHNNPHRVMELYKEMVNKEKLQVDAHIRRILSLCFEDSPYGIELMRKELEPQRPGTVPAPDSYTKGVDLLHDKIFAKSKVYNGTLDLHNLTVPEATLAVKAHIDALSNALYELQFLKSQPGNAKIHPPCMDEEFFIITGKGIGSLRSGRQGPLIRRAIETTLANLEVEYQIPNHNTGLIIVPLKGILKHVDRKRQVEVALDDQKDRNMKMIGGLALLGSIIPIISFFS